MRMLAAAILVMLSLPAVADVVDGVVYLIQPGAGLYIIDHEAGRYGFCILDRCLGPWPLPDYRNPPVTYGDADVPVLTFGDADPVVPPPTDPESDY